MKTSKWYYKKALDETQRLVSEIEQIVESYQCDSRKVGYSQASESMNLALYLMYSLQTVVKNNPSEVSHTHDDLEDLCLSLYHSLSREDEKTQKARESAWNIYKMLSATKFKKIEGGH